MKGTEIYAFLPIFTMVTKRKALEKIFMSEKTELFFTAMPTTTASGLLCLRKTKQMPQPSRLRCLADCEISEQRSITTTFWNCAKTRQKTSC